MCACVYGRRHDDQRVVVVVVCALASLPAVELRVGFFPGMMAIRPASAPPTTDLRSATSSVNSRPSR